MAEKITDAIKVAQAMLNGKRAFHYQAVFLGEDGKPTRHAEKVLAHLDSFCRGNQSTYRPDAREHALLEGRREVLLLMQRMLEIDSRDLRQFVEVKDE